MKKYIVYLITNKLDDMIYIGCHVTKNINDDYMGSGSNIRKAIKEIGIKHFHKDILYVFNNKEDMLVKELELVNVEFIKRTDTYNIILGGSWNTSGTVSVKDKDGNTFQVSVTDERYLSGELVGVTTGNVPVKDKEGNTSQVSVTDPRYLSGELVCITKGNVPVKDKDGKNLYISVTDPRYLSGELFHISKGNVPVKDKDGNNYKVSVDDERYLSGELVHNWTNRKHTEETKKLIGSKSSVHQKGNGSSQHGTCWIYHQESKENKKIKKQDLNTWLDLGWKKGRKMSFSNNYIPKIGDSNSHYGTCWIYNEELRKSKQVKKEDLNTWLDLGWVKGRKIGRLCKVDKADSLLNC